VSTIDGWFYDGRKAEGLPVRVTLRNNALCVEGDGVTRVWALAQVEPTTRVANTRRVLHLPYGQQVHTDDNEAIDAWFPARAPLERLVARLEHHPAVVAGSVLLILVALVGAFWWGVPWLANKVAHAMPAEIERGLGEQTLSSLDRWGFEPSELNARRIDRLNERFAELVANLDGAEQYRLEFRRAGMPNAFALPGGIVVVTDELAEILNNDQLTAVMAHEIGHHVHRHVMRQVLQGSAVAVAVSLLTGDAASASGAVTAIPIMLLESGYSRDFEREADTYAISRLPEVDLAPRHFADALRALREHVDADGAADDAGLSDYLSTHPATEERIRAAERASAPAP
jgi:Zn-dependent protease with chaperone function